MSERDLYLGIDPGHSGGLAIVDRCGLVVLVQPMPETERDTADIVQEFGPRIRMATLEKVGPMPKQGLSSTAKFMRHYGFLEGLLVAFHVPYELIRPQVWQKDMSCLSGGDKNVTKARAQGLFPGQKCTHAISDALLIAEHRRRVSL